MGQNVEALGLGGVTRISSPRGRGSESASGRDVLASTSSIHPYRGARLVNATIASLRAGGGLTRGRRRRVEEAADAGFQVPGGVCRGRPAPLRRHRVNLPRACTAVIPAQFTIQARGAAERGRRGSTASHNTRFRVVKVSSAASPKG